MWYLFLGRESSRWGRDSVTPEDRVWLHVISPLWVRCCWGNNNYPGFRTSTPKFPEKNQDSGASIGPVCGGQQVSKKKMVERNEDICNNPNLMVPWSTTIWTWCYLCVSLCTYFHLLFYLIIFIFSYKIFVYIIIKFRKHVHFLNLLICFLH